MKTKVAIIGLGYVGLPTFVAIAKTEKYNVVGYTRSDKRVKQILSGNSPIEDEDVTKYIKDNQLQVSNQPNILKNAQIFIICVPTPINKDYTPDYAPVISSTKLVAPYLKKGSHFVLESTVNPGTCEEIIQPILENETKLKVGRDFNISHCPERINPGDSKWNINNINRNIGSINKKLNREIAQFYRSFITSAVINEVSSLKVAEATKIVENAFRDINIAYVNELAQSFDTLGIDLIETLQASANKPFAFIPHWPGAGVGGHCIAVDPYYLIKRASLNGFDHKFLKLAREINNKMPKYTVRKLQMALNEVGLPLKNTRIALLGLSYKPNIADLRESPALEIEHLLNKYQVKLQVYDPFVKGKFKTLKQALKNVEAIVLATSHHEFVNLLPDLLKSSKVKVVIDGRNCLDSRQIKKLKIIYQGIGRQ
jgi:UDP-N-acetyl-D-glucosamine dehydrogenase